MTSSEQRLYRRLQCLCTRVEEIEANGGGGGGGGTVTAANNGLNLSGTTVKLGGTLLANTSITGGFNFGWSGIAALTGSSNTASITTTTGDISLVSAANIKLTFPTELVLMSTLGVNSTPTSFVTTSSTGTGNVTYSTVSEMQTALGIGSGASLPTFIEGSIPFADSSGILNEDNSNLFWDDSQNRLGIGTNSPNAELDLRGYASINPGTSSVGSTAIANLTQTWNNTSQLFGIFMSITDTASASSSLLADFRVGGSSKFGVRKDGLVTAANGLTLSAGTTTYSSALTNLVSPTTFLTMSGTSGATQYSSVNDVKTALSVPTVSDTAYGVSWDANTDAPSKNAVYDKIETLNTAIGNAVSDTAYAGSWNGVTTIAPSKNAVYDKIESTLFDHIGIVIDGQGGVISTGVKGYFRVPFDCTVTGWTIVAASATPIAGDIVVDVLWGAYASYPTVTTAIFTTKPTLTAQTNNQNLSPTIASGTLTKGDWIKYNVTSVSTVQKVVLTVHVTKT